MALIFVTRKIPVAGISLLQAAGHEVVVSEKDGVLTPEELLAAVSSRPYDAILSLLTDTIDGAVMNAAPQLRIVANYAVGYNNIDLAAAKERGVLVTNTPGVLTDTVAEFTVALILATVKRLPEADAYTRAGKYEGWAPELFLGSDLAGKTLGIIGGGRIGSGVARRMQAAFGMKVIYADIAPSPALEAEVSCTYCASLEELLVQSDVVSLHVPLNEATHHLINAERLALMKPSAYLVNTARGPVVDEAALVAALQAGTLRGAGLDVFEAEPALAPGLAELPQAVLAPHIASASTETRTKMSEIAGHNLIAALTGEQPENVVE